MSGYMPGARMWQCLCIVSRCKTGSILPLQASLLQGAALLRHCKLYNSSGWGIAGGSLQAHMHAAGDAARGERLVVEGCVLVLPSGEISGQVQVSAYSVSFFAAAAAESCTWCAVLLPIAC